MTANRWWVKLAARWLARVDGVNQQLRLLFLAMTGYGVVTNTLISAGLKEYVLPFIGLSGLVLAIYTYYYNEGGVRNQVSRDRQDLSSNYAGPNSRIDDEMIARGIIAGMDGEQLTEQKREAIKGELDKSFAELRDGVDLDGTQ